MNEAMNTALVSTVGPFLGARLRALDRRLVEIAPRVVASADDEEAVHDLRVALRRTRSVLEIGRDVLGRFHADEVRAAFRDLQRASGNLRDEEVLLELVESLSESQPALGNVRDWIVTRRRQERRLRRRLARCIQAGELDRGRRLLDALLAFRVDPAVDRGLVKFGRRAVQRARRRVERRRGARIDDAVALHELRIAYKRLRYVVETFDEALPSDLRALAQVASRLQNRLGAVHDVDVAVGSVRRARSLADDARAQLLAALARLRGERTASYARDARLPGQPPETPIHASGVVLLRKTSTR
jgi:CHAD domain-containing protein